MRKVMQFGLAALLSITVFVCFSPTDSHAKNGVDQTIWSGSLPEPQFKKAEEEITANDLLNAVRAGNPQGVDTRAEIVKLLIEVRKGQLSAEEFYQKVSALEMPPGKELRHTLMEVKKDVGNYLGQEGLKNVFGEVYPSGATRVEATILSHRKGVVMDTIKQAIIAYREKVKAATGEYPVMTFYYGEVGGWPGEKFREMKFAGDIDFNFLSGDLDQAMELKKIFDELIKKRYGRTPEDLDIPCTVHGMATGEVYVGKHGQSFAEAVTKVAWEIDFENASPDMDLKASPVPFKMVLETMVMEARVDAVNNAVDDLQSSKWPTQPGISLEMIRHFEHDIAGKDVFTNLESFVKAAKYADRSFSFLIKELGDDAKFDPLLKKFAEKLTKWKKDPKAQVAFIKLYFEKIGQPLPFEVELDINESGKGRATIEANQKVIEHFWDICRKAMWEGANQVLKKKTDDLKRRVNALGEADVEESKAIYEELVKLEEMIEIEDRILNDKVAGVHDIDPDYKANVADFRAMRKSYKEKSAKYGHVKYIDPLFGKTYKWIETMLQNPKDVNIRLAGAALFHSPAKLNDALDYFDDKLMNGLRNGEGQSYIKILRKGQGLYWDEQVNQFLAGTYLEGKFTRPVQKAEALYDGQMKKITTWLNTNFENTLSARGLKMVGGAGGSVLRGVQNVNRGFNEGMNSVPEGRALGGAMMLYSLYDELPLYYDLIDKDDYAGLAAEFFKRRIPFGGAVERQVMGDYYGAAWEVTSTMIPPLGIVKAAWGVGESISLGTIDAYFDEEMELFIDNLYDGAKFSIGGVEKVGEDLVINNWVLESVSYGGKEFDYQELIELEMQGAREMGDCLQKPTAQRPECFPMEKMGDGLFEWWRNREAFEHAFKKTDSWIQLILEMERHPSVGPKLKEHFLYQKWTRFEQIKVAFLKHTKQKLEERKAGEESIISGEFARMYEELLKITEDLDIRVQLEAKINEEFGGEAYQFMTWMKDYMRGTIRSLQGEVDVWDVYEELSVFVTKNLKAYQKVLDMRRAGEALLGGESRDQGLRLLTSPYFLEGDTQKDLASAQKWSQYPEVAKKKMMAEMSKIKAASEADPRDLDLSEGSYDAGILQQLTFHESFIEMWIQANKRIGFLRMPSFLGSPSSKQEQPNPEGELSDQDRATTQFAYHSKRVDEILAEFRLHYAAEEGGPDGEEASPGETESVFSGFESVLGRIAALYDEAKARRSDYKSQKKAYGKQVDAYEKRTEDLAERIISEVPTNAFSAARPQQIFNEIQRLSQQLSELRDRIEAFTLTVCQRYEEIKNVTDVKGVDRILADAESQHTEVKKTLQEAEGVIARMQELKEEALNLGETPEKLALADGLIREGHALLSEGEALKEKGGALQQEIMTLESYGPLAAALVAEANGLLEQIPEITDDTPKDQKKAIKRANRNYKGILSQEKKINKVTGSAAEISGSVEADKLKAGAFMETLKVSMDELEKRAGSAANADLDNMKAEIKAMYEAGMLFADPIKEAGNNAQICLEGVRDRNAQVGTPAAREAAADCSPFAGTHPKWYPAERVVRCDCSEGFVWAPAKNECIDRKQNDVANMDCTKYVNTSAVWSDTMQRAVCECVGEYEWNGAGTGCTPPRSQQMANTNCSQLGPMAQAVWDSQAGRARCQCVSGYVVNNGRCTSQAELDRHRRQEQEAAAQRRRENARQAAGLLTGILETVNQVQGGGGYEAPSGGGYDPPSSGSSTVYTPPKPDCASDLSTKHTGGLYGSMTIVCNCPGYGYKNGRCVQGAGSSSDNRTPAGFGGGSDTGGGRSNTGITTNQSRSQGAGRSTGGTSGGSSTPPPSYGMGSFRCEDYPNFCRWEGGHDLFGVPGLGEVPVYCVCGCDTAPESRCAGSHKPEPLYGN